MQHTEHCREQCSGGHLATDEGLLLHQILERMDRFEALVSPLIAAGTALLGKRLSKMALLRAGGKLSAEWKATDERD